MAAVLRSETVTPATRDAAVTAPAPDRRQWWEGVQSGVSAMLTQAAREAVPHRLAG